MLLDMNILEEIEMLETASELRDEIERVEEQIYELESDPYDAIDDQLDYQTLLKQQKDRLEELKSKNKTISQEIRDYFTKNNTIRKRGSFNSVCCELVS